MNRELKALVAAQGEILDKQDEIILQLTCKEDELKMLKNDDDDPDLGGVGD